MAFNSRDYEWSDISVAIGGKIIEGIGALEYNKKKSKKYKYGRGNKPKAIQHGNFEYEGKLSLWLSEVFAMEKSTADGELLNASFSITTAYAPNDGGNTVVETCQFVEFTEVPKSMKQGDEDIMVELPIMFLDVVPQ